MSLKNTKIYQFLVNVMLKKSCLLEIEEAYKRMIIGLDEFEIQYNWLYMDELRNEAKNKTNTDVVRRKINNNYNILIELIEIYSQIKKIKRSDFKSEIFEIYKDANHQVNKNVLDNFLQRKRKYFM